MYSRYVQWQLITLQYIGSLFYKHALSLKCIDINQYLIMVSTYTQDYHLFYIYIHVYSAYMNYFCIFMYIWVPNDVIMCDCDTIRCFVAVGQITYWPPINMTLCLNNKYEMSTSIINYHCGLISYVVSIIVYAFIYVYIHNKKW